MKTNSQSLLESFVRELKAVKRGDSINGADAVEWLGKAVIDMEEAIQRDKRDNRKHEAMDAALRAIIAKAPTGKRPDEEDYDDMETASSKGYDAGQYDAAHALAKIAKRGLAGKKR